MINIYPQEIVDGLAEQIAKSALAHRIDFKPMPAISTFNEKLVPNVVTASAREHLCGFSSLFVSSGWNGNHDVQRAEEVINARNTPINKPVTNRHTDGIIGHILMSMAVDDNIKELSEEALKTCQNLHLVVGSVVYKVWKEESKQKAMDKLIAQLANGELAVSMEATFDDFDYAIVQPDGKEIVVPRTQATAALSKVLPAYGGGGFVNGYKIGRVFKGIKYAGIGVVDVPANPKSLVLEVSNEDEIKKMIDTAVASCVKVNSNIIISSNKLENNVMEEKLNELESKFAALQASLDSKSKEYDAVKANLARASETVMQLTKKLDEATAAIAKYEFEKVQASRLVKLTDKKMDKVEASKLVKLFEKLTEEQFDAAASIYTPTEQPPTKTVEVVDLSTAEVAKADAVKLATNSNADAERTEKVQKALAEVLKKGVK